MLGFAPLSSVPIGALPATAGATCRTEGHLATQYGNHTAIWDQFGYPSSVQATQYGTPQSRRTQYADGFLAAQYGEPAGKILYRTAGFSSTVIGEPHLFPYHQAPWAISTQFGAPRLFPFHVAPWPTPSQVGTPEGRQAWFAEQLGIITRYGTPTTPTHQTGEAQGISQTNYGAPLAWRRAPGGQDVICRAQDFLATKYGTPAASQEQAGAATGFTVAQYGTPRAITTLRAQSLGAVTQFGSVMARQKQRATGFKAAAVGLPHSRRIQHAGGVATRVRYGTHNTIRSNWYVAYGFRTAKYGAPRAWQRFNYRVGEWPVSTQYGSPSTERTYPAAPIPPIARYGRPLLRRNAQC